MSLSREDGILLVAHSSALDAHHTARCWLVMALPSGPLPIRLPSGSLGGPLSLTLRCCVPCRGRLTT